MRRAITRTGGTWGGAHAHMYRIPFRQSQSVLFLVLVDTYLVEQSGIEPEFRSIPSCGFMCGLTCSAPLLGVYATGGPPYCC